jgi:ESF2/ABP1 family protein
MTAPESDEDDYFVSDSDEDVTFAAQVAALTKVGDDDKDDADAEAERRAARKRKEKEEKKEKKVAAAATSRASEAHTTTSSPAPTTTTGGDEDESDHGTASSKEAKNARKEKKKKKKKKVVKPMTPEALAKFQQEHDRRGVVYLSRIPPFMKALKLRQLLSQFGDVGRIYLRAEDPSITRRRKKFKGNRKPMFVDGWIEFGDKKLARRVAANLNATAIGGKKRGFYHDDLWNIKVRTTFVVQLYYPHVTSRHVAFAPERVHHNSHFESLCQMQRRQYLKGFKWTHLSEKIAHERQVREHKVRMEMALAKREATGYLEKVARAKGIAAMEEKRTERRKRARDDDANGGGGGGGGGGDEKPRKKLRQFHQRSAIGEEE